jgi:ParB-like chromosome segregation protein Spo0J
MAKPPDSPLKVTVILVAMILNLLHDRKDRTSKRYFEHETAIYKDILTAGIRNPIKVIPEGNKFRVISGQTRLNALRRAGLSEVPAIILGELSPFDRLIIEFTDNNMAEEFDNIAQAEIFTDMMRLKGWTQAELCANVPAAKPGTVSRALSMIEGLTEEMKTVVRAGECGFRLGYQLSRLPAEKQVEMFQVIKKMKVEAAEAYILDIIHGGKKKSKKDKPLKISIDGANALLPGNWNWLKLSAFGKRLLEAAAKGEKNSLPFEYLPHLLRNPAES